MRRFVPVHLLVLVTCADGSEPIPSSDGSMPASATTGRSCSSDQVSFTPGTEGAGGAAVIYLEIRHVGAPCLLDASAKLRIEDGRGALISVEGNPAAQTITRVLPGESDGVMWQWRNWCGGAISILLVFSVAGKIASLVSRAGPRCDEPSGASTLVPIPL